MTGLEDNVDFMTNRDNGYEDKLLLSANERTLSDGTGSKLLTGCEDIIAINGEVTSKATTKDGLSHGTGSQVLDDIASEDRSLRISWPSNLVENFRGYKAVILFASFGFYMVNCGVGLSAGVYFVTLQEDFKAGSSLTSLTSSLYTGVLYLTAPLSSFLVDRYGFRVVVMTGGLLATIGCLATAFANSIYVVLVTFAVICPFGAGLAYVPALTVIAAYYDEQGRAFALPLASVGCGFGQFIMTNVLAAAIDTYTWRGAMFISAGVIMQIVVLGALMRTPKSWRKLQQKQSQEKCFNGGQILRIYKNTELVMFFLHYTLMTCGLSIIYGHITAVTETFPGVLKQQAALPLSMVGLSMIIGRGASGLLGQLKDFDVFLFYCLASLASGVVIMLVPIVSGYTFTVICTFVFGLMLAPYGSLFNIVILYFCDLSDLNAAFAQMSLLSGLGFMAGAPLAGWLYAMTKYYGVSIYLGGALNILSSLLLVWPYMSYRRRHAKDVTIIGDQAI